MIFCLPLHELVYLLYLLPLQHRVKRFMLSLPQSHHQVVHFVQKAVLSAQHVVEVGLLQDFG